ncbi:MAG TPA: hypothetical protein VFI41_04950 [Gemmatimonadales bacterium]|nr:hypothetical protein [Gemmatimonadales bacterium]
MQKPGPHGSEDDGEQQAHDEPERRIYFPAAFTDTIIRFIGNSGLLPARGVILDPFAGIGRVHQLASVSLRTVGVEIEPEWAAVHANTVVGNALNLPFEPESFDGCVTSPVYGNRMSDSHKAKDTSIRRSYTHDLRRTTGDSERQLHPDNAGTLYAWQKEYWRFHVRAWAEVKRVLKHDAPFLLNVSDFIRTTQSHGRKRLPVVRTHLRVCTELGFKLHKAYPIETPRMRYGQNSENRTSYEYVLHMTKG